MIKVDIDGSKYEVKELMKDCNINDYQKIQNIINKKESKKYGIFDKMGECVSFLSNIPDELIDLISIVKLKELFDKSTLIDFNKDNKIKNSFTIDKVKYKTISKFEKYEDIILNRLQYKLIQDVNNHMLVLTAVVFLEDIDQDLRSKLDMKNVKNRVEIFKNKVKFKDVLPYIMKWIDTTVDLSNRELDIPNKLTK